MKTVSESFGLVYGFLFVLLFGKRHYSMKFDVRLVFKVCSFVYFC